MLLSNAGATPGRPHLKHTSSASSGAPQDLFSDARTHGYQGPSRHVRLPRVTGGGNAAIAKSEDGIRCAVAGRESLRILRISPPDAVDPGSTNEHKFSLGRGGFRVEASRNIWDGSGLHIDSANTDVAWCQGVYSNKILTSARNGELIMWDLNKSGPSKCECRIRGHTRSIHSLAYSPLLEKYCVTASADGDLRVWDLRDLSRSQMWIRHPGPVRAVVFSPVAAHPLQAICGLDNGAIYRWDLNMGQRGQLDRLLAAHGGPILSLDWTVSAGSGAPIRNPQTNNWYGASSTALGLLDEIIPSGPLQSSLSSSGDQMEGAGMGWLASGGLDRCVKVWDLTTPLAGSHISHDPTYTLRTAFPVRRVLWRPGYECELAVVAHTDQGVNSSVDLHAPGVTGGHLNPTGATAGTGTGLVTALSSPHMSVATLGMADSVAEQGQGTPLNDGGAPVEIWDVRRGFIAKWLVTDSAGEGGVRDIAFADSHAIWAQHSSGAFSQLDLRYCSKPLNSISRTAVTWDPVGTLAFVTDQRKRWEVPYDDVKPEKRQLVHDWNGITKALGDPPFVPRTQSYGTVSLEAPEEVETFVQLAQGYVYEGTDRLCICAHNAKVAMNAGHIDAAQTWLTLRTLLNNLVPELPSIPLNDRHSVPLAPECVSAPAAIHPLPTSPSSALSHRSMSIDRSSARGNDERSPSSLSREHIDSVPVMERKSPRPETPASSTTSSPRKPSTSLPHLQTALYSRRGSSVGQGQAMRPRLSSSYRRPSSSFLSSPSIRSLHSDSPGDSSRSTPSLKHVGEGALDDSDSSEGEEDSALVVESRSDSGDEEVPHAQATYTPLRPSVAVHPSPLAHQQVWTEDEGDNDDEESPSPGSSSDSDGRGPTRRPKLKRSRTKSRAHSRTRSRSSTVASLAVNAASPKLVRKASSNSVSTVVAPHTTDQDDSELHSQSNTKPEKAARPLHNRTRSTTFADEVKIGLNRALAKDSDNGSSEHTECSASVREAEMKLRELGWSALREVVEDLADQGDVQMCALLSLVASKELRIGPARTLQFVEAYITILVRLRLHTAAAYMRKYVDAEDIRATTALQTTIYTCCTRCRKPIILPAARMGSSGYPVGSYAYCTSCRTAISRCSICHLPVRALAFTCPVCLHGGHQECYRNLYLRRPMVVIASGESTLDPEAAQPLPSPSFPPSNAPFLGPRGRSSSRTSSLFHDSRSDESSRPRTDDSTKDADVMHQLGYLIQGHACAAGCGHFCWATQQSI